MARWLASSRALLAFCGVLVVLLGALAALQYRWSARVAQADVQREREHLRAAAALFTTGFNAHAERAVAFLQNDASRAVKSGEPLKPVPPLLAELYYLETPADRPSAVRRLTGEGLFAPAPTPAWMTQPRCATATLEQPPALIVPIYEITTAETRGGPAGLHIMNMVQVRGNRCFVAPIDQAWLKATVSPKLLQAFGPTAALDYDFAIVSHNRPDHALYGTPLTARADLRRQFFAAPPSPALPKPLLPSPLNEQASVIIRRVESQAIVGGSPVSDLYGDGAWELQVAHKNMPLAAAFERKRWRDLMLSLAVEVLLGAAIVFLAIGARRMDRLAEQKMRFVAGVSHELRSPVSAIAMLSRNQADGLVAGPDRVKQYGELIHQQARRLNEMVEQSLEYAGIHSGLRRPDRSAVDIRRLIEDAVDARRDALVRAGIEIDLALNPDLPPVWGDPKLLRTALDNLLSNAGKHASAGRWMRVSAVHNPSGKEVLISVEDRGAGIEPAGQAEVFEPFCRGRAAIEAQTPGSGLGLSLVRGAVEAHRGTVTLASVPGRGCTFTMHLPV
jgi:two-component system, OmpR family, sensor histidine kinase SenX3